MCCCAHLDPIDRPFFHRLPMTTPPPSTDGSDQGTPTSRRGRAIVLWSIFVLLLAAGVVFAFRFGASVPVLLDSVN